MADCPLLQTGDGRWHCPVCDPRRRDPLPVPAARNCRGEPQNDPPPPAPLVYEQLGPCSGCPELRLGRILYYCRMDAPGCGCDRQQQARAAAATAARQAAATPCPWHPERW